MACVNVIKELLTITDNQTSHPPNYSVQSNASISLNIPPHNSTNDCHLEKTHSKKLPPRFFFVFLFSSTWSDLVGVLISAAEPFNLRINLFFLSSTRIRTYGSLDSIEPMFAYRSPPFLQASTPIAIIFYCCQNSSIYLISCNNRKNFSKTAIFSLTAITL